MQTLEEKLGYHFQNIALLENALTHSSYANEHKAAGLESNERLEFLGDSVLGMVVADYLYRHCPTLPEGDLTRLRAGLVCEGNLVLVAKELELGSYLKLGKGEELGGGRRGVGAGCGVSGRRHQCRPAADSALHPESHLPGSRRRQRSQDRPAGDRPAQERPAAHLHSDR